MSTIAEKARSAIRHVTERWRDARIGSQPRNSDKDLAMPKTVGKVSNIPLSPALIQGNMVFVSGQVPVDDDGAIIDGIEAQTRLVLDKIKELVEAAGSSMDKVVKTTVFLTDKKDFAAMNSIYSEYFPASPPARSTIECGLMIDIKVEIEAIAAI